MKKELKFKAVLDSDVYGLLGKLGLLELFERGKLKCAVCGKKITPQNFYCIFVKEGEIRICCDNIPCYEMVSIKQLEEENA